jgi:transposase
MLSVPGEVPESITHYADRLILGDSLLVMASLAEKERLRGKVQCVYFDPPYGIKFGSNWQVSTRKRDVKDAKAEDLTRQPEQIKAFRDTWELGIHSYLSYMRDRLAAARDLLTESGSIFVQIGDENVHLIRMLMDEVFGSENFVAQISFKSADPLGQIGYLLRALVGKVRALVGKVIVVWDGGTNHKGPVMRAFLARNRRLHLERLPPYAPELNPVEQVWGWLKFGQLAHFVPDDLEELDDKILDRLIRLRCDPKLLRALWERSDLPFPNDPS